MKWLKSVDSALFGWGSPVALGVIRIVTGGLALVNFLMLAIDFDAWFTERGFIPLWHSQKWGYLGQEKWFPGEIPRLNLLNSVTDSGVTLLVYVLCCLACLFTMLGLWTRLSSIAMFVLMTTLHHRSPDILHSGDTLLRQMAFLVMIAPSGRACSLDRLIALWKGRATQFLAPVSLWPQRLMQFQVTVVYFTTVWHKWSGSHWRDGTATWFVPQLHEFDRFPVPAFFDQQPFVAVTTYATLLVELGVAFLAYARPLRKWVLLAGVLLHAGIEYRFNIPMFSFVMTSTYLAFYDGEEFSALAKRIGDRLSKLQLIVYMPIGTDLSTRGEAFLRAVDAFNLMSFEQGDLPHWSAVTKDGRTVNPYWAVLGRSPALWGLSVVPFLWKKLLDACLVKAAEPKPTRQTAQVVNS